MNEQNRACDAVLDRLLAFLRGGAELSEADRAHLAACPDCSRALRAARSLQDELARADMPGDDDPGPLEHATRKAQSALGRARRQRAAVIVLISLGVLAAWLLAPTGPLGWPEKLVLFIVVSLLAATIVGGFIIVRRLATRAGGRRLYRRVGRGGWLAGVCAGLSEASGVSVWAIRAVFVGLLFVWKIGIPLYVLLALALDVHPEDRGRLLRFRLRRWLSGRSDG